MEKILEITIIKTSDTVSINHTDGADIHEMIGLLATCMNHLTLQSQGIDMTKAFESINETADIISDTGIKIIGAQNEI